MSNRNLSLFLVVFFCLSCSKRPQSLTITFVDVGQGDATIIQFPNGVTWLIDAGGRPGGPTETGSDPGHRTVLPVLRALGVNSIDTVIMTHPDEDHIQGMLAIARHIRVREVYWNGFTGGETEMKVRETFTRRGVIVTRATRGMHTNVGGATIAILHPRESPLMGTRSPENDNSIVLLIKYLSNAILLTGDIEADGERQVCENLPPQDITLLKVAHHGSKSSTTERFLATFRVRTAVISVGEHNRYGHPNADVLRRLQMRSVRTLRTDQCGMIQWLSNGITDTVTSYLPCQ